jgi:hypothetical protein
MQRKLKEKNLQARTSSSLADSPKLTTVLPVINIPFRHRETNSYVLKNHKDSGHDDLRG